MLTSAYAPFNGTFSYILIDIVNGLPFYAPGGDPNTGELVYLFDPDGFQGWVVEIDHQATDDFALFYGPKGTQLPPTNVGLYTTTPPAGFDPNSRVVVLVSITPVH